MDTFTELSFPDPDYVDASESLGPKVLDMEEQRLFVSQDHLRNHRRWCEAQEDAARLSLANRRIFLKVLINEACSREMSTIDRQDRAARMIVRKKWSAIAAQVEEEMRFADNSQNVLKNFSCMCIFLNGAVCSTYGENPDVRTARVANKIATLDELRTSNSLFLCSVPQ